ncbi:MAG: zinc ribbon domain-containing protein [Thermoleophilia bacterium]
MFCPQCGTQLEGGKGFCKHCGARLSDYPAPSTQVAGAPPAAPTAPTTDPPAPPLAESRTVDPPPLPGAREDGPPPVTFPTLPSAATVQQSAAVPPPFAAPPPPTPPPFAAAPPPPFPPAPPSAPVADPYAGAAAAAARNDRPGWVIPLLAAMGVIIVGSIIGLALVVTSGSGDSPRATGTVATGTTLAGTTTISGPPTETTVGGESSGTTATIPGYDPNSTTVTASGGAAGGSSVAYISTLDALETVLARADSRIPELAQEINASAPRVPSWVSRELEGLSADILTAQDALAANDPPADFQSADDLLFQACGEMLYRIDQTYQGIDAMWTAGTVAAGNPYFDEGRKARDDYRRFFDRYRAARPFN